MRVPAISDDDDRANWQDMIRHLRGIESIDDLQGREYIIELMRERASDELRVEEWDNATSNSFFYDTDSHIRAYEFANTTDLIDWISNTVGSDYESDGFAEKTYFTTTLRDELISIYNNFY